MELKLEQLDYQQEAIKSVISVFNGQERNTFDNANFEGIRSNQLSLTSAVILENISKVIIENGIEVDTGVYPKS